MSWHRRQRFRQRYFTRSDLRREGGASAIEVGSLVAYQTAYFKTHHPAAFMAANMSAVMDDTDKVQLFALDTRAHGIEVLPPDVNRSGFRFEPVGEKAVRYGLGGIKGTGEAAINSILEARKEAPFTDLFDFCRRVDKRLVNRRVVESLIRVGLEPTQNAFHGA